MNKIEGANIKTLAEFSERDVRDFYRFLSHPAGAYTEIRAINPQRKRKKQYFVRNENAFVAKCRELDGNFDACSACGMNLKSRIELTEHRQWCDAFQLLQARAARARRQ